jgi:hypothetical protein
VLMVIKWTKGMAIKSQVKYKEYYQNEREVLTETSMAVWLGWRI